MNNSKGHIKIDRKVMDNKFYFSEPFTRMSAWFDLLLMANYKPSVIYVRGIKVDIDRGQLATSSKSLAERWRWSRGKVERYLNELEIEQQIEQQKNNVINLISITNYNKYQDNKAANRTADETADGQQTEQQIGQQTDTSNKDKEINTEKEDINNSLSLRARERIGFDVFGEFHNVYLKPEQRRALTERFGDEKTHLCIEDLSCRLEEGNDDELNNSKSHYATLLHWLQYQQNKPVTGFKQSTWKVDLNALKI
ncbi:MAG: hypothetical protein II662_06205 [Bacteroidales bacterium]|nr:hypothetical protein [Bacteroidales bacterium]